MTYTLISIIFPRTHEVAKLVIGLFFIHDKVVICRLVNKVYLTDEFRDSCRCVERKDKTINIFCTESCFAVFFHE